MASPSAKSGNEENMPIRSAPSATGIVQPSATPGMRKLNSKKAKAKTRKAKKAGNSKDSESPEPASASTVAAVSTNALATQNGVNEEEHGHEQSKRAKKMISRHEKKRKQEFKMVKRNKPHFTNAQAWAVVDMVDDSASLQDENARDMLVLSSESDSDWDEEKLVKDRGLTRQS